MRNWFLVQFFTVIFILTGRCEPVFAETSYTFTCEDSKINASIKYNVIGRYQAKFGECSGHIKFGDTENQIKAVRVQIKTDSIGSNCGWCDKIVLSKQLLDSGKYPVILFEGSDFEKNDLGHSVLGTLDLHGVTQDLQSQFKLEETAGGNLVAKGKWVIPRKDFKIIWNKVLDRGGVLVGDQITVDWEIRAKRK